MVSQGTGKRAWEWHGLCWCGPSYSGLLAVCQLAPVSILTRPLVCALED